jgi:hypothetical protein
MGTSSGINETSTGPNNYAKFATFVIGGSWGDSKMKFGNENLELRNEP